MSCQKFEAYLNELLDHKSLMLHIQSCAECRRAYETDKCNMDIVKNLNTNLTVPDFWPAIEKKIQNEKPVVYKFKKIKRILFAAAATFLILTTIWIFHSFREETPSTRILSENALEKVKEAETSYLEAIKELEDLAYKRLEDTQEPLAQLYRNKLLLIDRQIENCKQALETNPANSHIRRYLMAALKDKRETLEEILKENHKTNEEGS